MFRQHSFKVLEKQCWQIGSCMIAGADEQFRADLLENAVRKIGRRSVIHRYCDDAAISAPQKGCDPRRRVRSPEHDTIAFAHLSCGKFSRETIRAGRDFCVAFASDSISAPLAIGLLTAKPLEIQQVVSDASSCHSSSLTYLDTAG